MKVGNTVNRPFPTTQWSLIARVSSGNEEKRAKALEELCELYWAPVYAFIRSKGASQTESEDLTQGFFADLLARDNFAKVSSEMGKLRTFLLTSCKNYMANDWRSKQCLKRGGGVEMVSLDLTHEDSHDRILEPEEKDTPESIFDRQWALTLLHHVVETLQKSYEAKGKGELFDALRFVISSENPSTPYKQIAADQGMSESSVKVAAHRLKERYGKLLRETVADTLMDDADVTEELRDLMRVFE